MVTRSCNRTKNFWLCAKYWDLNVRAKKFMHFNLFCIFSSSCFTHNKWSLVLFLHFFLRKISKLKFWPRKKSTFRMSGTSIVILPQILVFTFKKIVCFLFKAPNCLETCKTPLFAHIEVQFSFFFLHTPLSSVMLDWLLRWHLKDINEKNQFFFFNQWPYKSQFCIKLVDALLFQDNWLAITFTWQNEP